MLRLFIIISVFLVLSACSSSYEKLKIMGSVEGRAFEKNLFIQYKNKAKFEAEQMHDWNSAKLYSEKALLAAKGEQIKPQKLDYWKISQEKINELHIAYSNLMIIYNQAINSDPYHLAIAISSLDCWAEQQEENWQTWDINRCKNDFLNSMHQIYKNIENENKKTKDLELGNKKENNESITIVTKNKEEKVLQLIYFDFDKSYLSEVSINKIKEFIIKNNTKIEKYLIIGHTDTKGSEKYNRNLSLDRANAVKKIFVESGILESKITILAMGEKNLRVKTLDEVAHPANRRAEIKGLN